MWLEWKFDCVDEDKNTRCNFFNFNQNKIKDEKKKEEKVNLFNIIQLINHLNVNKNLKSKSLSKHTIM